jgi:uncharacterized protein YjeT (DUF2065 family)
MQIQGTLSSSDYVAAQRLHIKPRPWLAVVGVLLVTVGVVVAYIGKSWGLVFALTYLMGMFLIYMPFKAKRTFRQYKALSEPVSIEVRDDGLFFTRINGEALVPWSHIAKWRSNRKLLLLYPASNVFHLIPSGFFPTQDAFIEFVKIVESKVGKAT